MTTMPVGKIRATLLGLPLLLAGCGVSPPVTFHTLTRYASDSAPLAVSPARRPGVLVGPVSVPDLVNRPQLVIRSASNQVEIKEQQRWAGPLPADIAQAMAENLALRLPEAYVYSQLRSPANAVPPRYRVALDVQRFESSLQDQPAGATLELAWVITEVASGNRQTCRSLAQAPLQGKGYAALVAAHQQALAAVSADIASALAQLGSGVKQPGLPARVICQG